MSDWERAGYILNERMDAYNATVADATFRSLAGHDEGSISLRVIGESARSTSSKSKAAGICSLSVYEMCDLH